MGRPIGPDERDLERGPDDTAFPAGLPDLEAVADEEASRCAAAENGMEPCGPDHVARGVTCEPCTPAVDLSAVLALPSVAPYAARRAWMRQLAIEVLARASFRMDIDDKPGEMDGDLLADDGLRRGVSEALRAAGLVLFRDSVVRYTFGPKTVTRIVATEAGRARLERMLDVLGIDS